MNKAELIDAIASGSKLTKADAGRYGSPQDGNSTSPRTTLAAIASLWNVLTEAEQQSWNDAAVGFPAKNKFGDIYTPSGYQVFMKLNSNLALINNPLLRSGPVPAFPELPPIEPPSGDPPELLRFTFPAGIDPNTEILVYASACVLPGSGIVKGKQKLLGTTAKLTKADAGRGLDATIESIHKDLAKAKRTFQPGPVIIDVTYQYQNLFGQVKPGSICYIKFVAVSKITGQTSVERILRIVNAPNPRVPRIGKYVGGITNLAVSAGKDWIIPFRIFGFNLTAPLILSTPVTPANEFFIGKTENGPWVKTFQIGLNELAQPKQNVCYLRIQVAAPGLAGSIINLESVGATATFIGIGVNAVDQSMPDPTIPIAFGDVYTGPYTIKEFQFPYAALRSDISLSIMGADAGRFQVAFQPEGPWMNTDEIPVRGTGSDTTDIVYLRTIPGGTGVLSAILHADAGGDLVYDYTLSATAIDGILSSPMSPGDSIGNQDNLVEIMLPFQIDADGLVTDVECVVQNLVNCTVVLSELMAGPYGPIVTIPAPGGVLVAKQVWQKIVPLTPGVFSWKVLVVGGGALGFTLTYDGLSV